jgi:hypothetical protein
VSLPSIEMMMMMMAVRMVTLLRVRAHADVA